MTYRATRPPQQGGWDLLKDWASREFSRVQQAFQKTPSLEQGEFLPTFTFDTPGDLSLSAYASQEGYYWLVGPLLYFTMRLEVTPTYTTASGDARFGGLPYPCVSSDLFLINAQISNVNVTYPTSRTDIVAYIDNAQNYLTFFGQGSATSADGLNTTHFTSGATIGVVRATGFYPIK